MGENLPTTAGASQGSKRECACGPHTLPVTVNPGYYVDNPHHAECSTCGETYRHGASSDTGGPEVTRPGKG